MTTKFQFEGQMSRRKTNNRNSTVERQTQSHIELRMLALLEVERRRLLDEIEEVLKSVPTTPARDCTQGHTDSLRDLTDLDRMSKNSYGAQSSGSSPNLARRQ
jgi:hypothetical protein